MSSGKTTVSDNLVTPGNDREYEQSSQIAAAVPVATLLEIINNNPPCVSHN